MSALKLAECGPMPLADVRKVFSDALVRMSFLTEGVFRPDRIEHAVVLRALLRDDNAGNGLVWIIGGVVAEMAKLRDRISTNEDFDWPDMSGEACNVIGILNLAESSGIVFLNFTEVASDRVLYGLIETLHDAHNVLEQAIDEIDTYLANANEEVAA